MLPPVFKIFFVYFKVVSLNRQVSLYNEKPSIFRLTDQLILNAVAFKATTVTFLGATSGTVFNVVKPLDGELGALLPTTFCAMSRSW